MERGRRMSCTADLRVAPSFDLTRGGGANNEIGRDQRQLAESSVRENAFSGGKDEKSSSSSRCPNASTRTSVDEEKPTAAAAAATTTTNDLQQQQQQDKKFGKVLPLLQRCSSANSVAATYKRMNKRPASYLELYSRRFTGGSSKDVTTTIDPGPTKVTAASSHERQSSISSTSRSSCSCSCASSSICGTDRTSSNEFGSRRRAVVDDEKPQGATNLGSVEAVDDDSSRLHQDQRQQRSRSRSLLCDSSWDYGMVKRDRSHGSSNSINAIGPNKQQQQQEQIDLDAKRERALRRLSYGRAVNVRNRLKISSSTIIDPAASASADKNTPLKAIRKRRDEGDDDNGDELARWKSRTQISKEHNPDTAASTPAANGAHKATGRVDVFSKQQQQQQVSSIMAAAVSNCDESKPARLLQQRQRRPNSCRSSLVTRRCTAEATVDTDRGGDRRRWEQPKPSLRELNERHLNEKRMIDRMMKGSMLL